MLLVTSEVTDAGDDLLDGPGSVAVVNAEAMCPAFRCADDAGDDCSAAD